MKIRTESYDKQLDRVTIYYPHPQDLAPGMMVRPGIVIKEVDGERALVGHSIGGRRERWEWTHYSEIECAWMPFADFDEAMEMIDGFGRAVEGLNPRRICSWCGTVMSEGTEPATHGICPDCERTMGVDLGE